MSLAARLREETRELHRAAEGSAAMRALLAGRMDRAAYARLLRALHAMYVALEAGLAAHAARPGLAWIPLAALARSASLAADLDVVAGAAWRETPPVAEAAAYADRLTTLAAKDPDLLAAHAYLRYLGDLSGGRLLGRAVRDSLGLTPERGAAFYEFPEVPDVGALRRAFRAGLDAAPLDADGVVDEARRAFAAHGRLFAALDATR